MASFQRRVLPGRHALIETSTLWRAGLALLGVGAFIVARACGYEFDTVTRYVAYFGLYLVSGLIESVLLLRKHLVEKKAAALAAVIDDDDEDDSDDDVDEQEVL